MLERISSPQDLQALSQAELVSLAGEIRDYLVDSVAKTGGHLGPNLGVVELSIALHRVFDSPRDAIVFDTGHQSYIHKLLTGRQDFSLLRKRGGLAGYPQRSESEHDVVENSHASTALSWAAGIGRGFTVKKELDRTAVAVIGDGALTGGMAWEALNSLADSDDRVVIVVNDNGRSYGPTIGGLARKLDGIRTNRRYENFLGWGKRTFENRGRIRNFTYGAVMRLKRGAKGVLSPQGMFEDLGIKYVGPVDGHDIEQLEWALKHARNFAAPVIVHVITEKGRGYVPAEQDHADRFHAVGTIHPETGLPVQQSRFGWTKVFAEEMVRAADERDDLVGITAAMLAPVGLQPFAEKYPERVIDVGIAEQHAVTSAAGLAFAGLHPVIAVYATFLNRAFDQVLMDAALHGAGITIMLDRAGITGDDGPSHHGIWDLALMRLVPGIQLAAPRDEETLRTAFRQAIAVENAPTVVRYPKGALSDAIPALRRVGGFDLLTETPADEPRVVVIGTGAFASTATQITQKLAAEGIPALAASATWVWPVPEGLGELIQGSEIVVSLEDGLVEGGLGEAWEVAALRAGSTAEWIQYGVPREFIAHSTRAEILSDLGIEASSIADVLVDKLRTSGE